MSHRSPDSKPRRIESLVKGFQESRPQDTRAPDYLIRHDQWITDCMSVAREQYIVNPAFDQNRFLNDCGIPTKATIMLGDVDGNK